MLLATHRSPAIALEAIAEPYLGMMPENASKLASGNKLPFPTFRLRDSRKAPHMVFITDLAKFIDEQHKGAQVSWERSQV